MENRSRPLLRAASPLLLMFAMSPSAWASVTYTLTQNLPAMHSGDQPSCTFSVSVQSYIVDRSLVPWSSRGTPNANATLDGYVCNGGPNTSYHPEVQQWFFEGNGYVFLAPHSAFDNPQNYTFTFGAKFIACAAANDTAGCGFPTALIYSSPDPGSPAGGSAWAPDVLTVTSTCGNINIDPRFSNGLLDVSVTGCNGILTIRNNKNYWTNFQITPVGFVTATPVGLDANVYAKIGLLPPSGVLGAGTAVQYNVQFLQPGDGISIYVDPSGQTGNGAAKVMNIVQIILNAAGVGSLQVVGSNYEVVVQTFAQMPHLSNADAALFSNPPNPTLFLGELGLFFASPTELSTFASMVGTLAVSNGKTLGIAGFLQVLGHLVGAPVGIIYAAIQAVGNVIALDFQYPSGSELLTAQ